MPQNPQQVYPALNPSNVAKPIAVDPDNVVYTAKNSSGDPAVPALDAAGNLPAFTTQALSTSYNITAATVVKATPGKLAYISVVTAGSAAGSANDCATTGAAAAGNKVATIPAAVGVIPVNWPCGTGITITPGSGQVIAVSYA